MSDGPLEVIQPEAKATVPSTVVLSVPVGFIVTVWAFAISLVVVTVLDLPGYYLLAGPATGLASQVAMVLYGVAWARRTEYLIYGDKIRTKTGVVRRSVTDVRFDRTTDLKHHQGLADRIMGTGSIEVNTAGSNDAAVTMSLVADANEVYRRLQDRVTSSPP